MAIAGITIHTSPEAYEPIRERLRDCPAVVEAQETGSPCMWAAVLESDAARIEDELGALGRWDGVLNVGLVSVSYEDELETKGEISCPAHKPRQSEAACFGEAPNPLAGEGR